MRTLSSFNVIVRAGVLSCAVWMLPSMGMVLGARAAPSVIRDAEVESIIRSYANPLFVAGGISPDAVTIRILNTHILNAFVTNGNRMFLHSGLIMRTKTPGQLTGVIAHESGHIAGGHLVRLEEQNDTFSTMELGSIALGLLTGIASGRGDVGMAALSLGTTLTTRKYFSFTRTVEASADQFALKVLDRTHQSAQGMLDFFETLQGEESLLSSTQNPYVRTHPLTRDRIEAVRRHVKKAALPYGATTLQQMRHDRMVAKLFAFLEPQARTLQRYPESDNGMVARYARCISYFRRGALNKAQALIDGLLRQYPDDPYFWELKGQMLFENARLDESVTAYRKAVQLAPEQLLIRLALSHVLVEMGTVATDKEAEKHLEKVLTAEPNNRFAWRLLGTVQGRQGHETQASYAMAEYAVLSGDTQQALYHVNKALKDIEQADPLWLRLQDLKGVLEPDDGHGAPEKGGHVR